ncbi:MAG TPA: BrnT family toxin [Fimbriimonadaceae bacterium]|nr:BrnT family toxin [Fimbriimonadaceae bacterium]
MRFEWDPQKAIANQEKHGVSFELAQTVFEDPRAITYNDPDHSGVEQREITIGVCENLVILTVAHTDRDGNLRIISARRATSAERRRYEED